MPPQLAEKRAPTLAELVSLCAVDDRLFCKTFFPLTFRDEFPSYSDRIDDALASCNRYINLQIFRGGAKTTKCRAYAARRIAYGQSRTIMIITAAQDKAEKTVRWLKKAVTRNRFFASTFQLRPGRKWAENEIEVIHDLYHHTVAVVAFGIHGSVRGVNIDDYRPDLILVDDVVDEENSATVLQRDKIENLILGAVKNTLAPASECPDAKLVLLQTPLNAEDVSMKAAKDPQYLTIRQPCWTADTENLPLEMRRSVWEKRFPSKDLIKDKIGHIARNKASIFSREMEVKIVTAETAAFKREWLRYYDPDTMPSINKMHTVLAIDPVPPPSPNEVAKDLHTKNYEVLACVGHYKGDYYLLEYQCNRGHDPSWTVKTMFDLARKWKVKEIVVETFAYQKTLAWLLNAAMQTQRFYIPLTENRDKRSKFDKISDAFSQVCPFGNLYILPSMADFISQFTDYPSVVFDDILDAIAQAITRLKEIQIADSSEGYDDPEIEDGFEPVKLIRSAP
jgi:phage terminase large subunit-like protein